MTPQPEPVTADQVVRRAFADGIRPDPVLAVSEWAGAHRRLAGKASSAPGRWRNERTPYLVEIMDSLSHWSEVEVVVFMKGAQVGGTEAGLNWIGYTIDQSPCPMMHVQPTVEIARRTSKTRIAPLIEETPRLAEKVRPSRSRDSGNTQFEKEFPGGVLILAGANSATALRSMPAGRAFLDEVDAYPGDVDGEGDPVKLVERRLATFPRSKMLLVSTPTIQGRSRIESSFEDSDQRHYHVPCPHCGEFQPLEWEHLRWDKELPKEEQPASVLYHCRACGTGIEEAAKPTMLAQGCWVAKYPDRRVRGYHLSSLYSPLGWYSWQQAVRDWLEATGDENSKDRLRTFFNTVLGLTWRERGDAPKWERLYRQREAYPIGTVPTGAYLLTAGVDVQQDRLEVEVVGWGPRLESWSVDYRVLQGDPAQEETWAELDELLATAWPHADGGELQIRAMAVDAGHATEDVYRYAARHGPRRVLAIRGQDRLAQVLGPMRVVELRRGRRAKVSRRGGRYFPVGVSHCKHELYGWLRQDPPLKEGDRAPFGFCHFPRYDEEFFRQLTAEELVVRKVRGFSKPEWTKTRDRNEALDCRVYARAAAHHVKVGRLSDRQWAQLRELAGPGAKAPKAQAPRKKRRRRGGARADVDLGAIDLGDVEL